MQKKKKKIQNRVGEKENKTKIVSMRERQKGKKGERDVKEVTGEVDKEREMTCCLLF